MSMPKETGDAPWWTDGRVANVLRYLLPLLVLAVWDLASRMGLVSSLFLPSPSEIVESIWRLQVEDDLATNFYDTVIRLLSGSVLGSLAGMLTALLMVAFRPIGRGLDPIITGLYALPKVAFLPLLVIWLGIGEPSKIMLIASGAYFPVLVNIYAGARHVNPVLIRAARNLGASKRQVLWRVILPAVTPELFAGLKIGLGVALTLAVYAEMIGVGSGIGYLTQTSASLFEMGKAYGALVVLIVIAFGTQKILLMIQNYVCAWQHDRTIGIE